MKQNQWKSTNSNRMISVTPCDTLIWSTVVLSKGNGLIYITYTEFRRDHTNNYCWYCGWQEREVTKWMWIRHQFVFCSPVEALQRKKDEKCCFILTPILISYLISTLNKILQNSRPQNLGNWPSYAGFQKLSHF